MDMDNLKWLAEVAKPQTASTLTDRVADHANEVVIKLQADVDRLEADLLEEAIQGSENRKHYEQRIAELEAERSWIPLSERYPSSAYEDVGRDYRVATRHGDQLQFWHEEIAMWNGDAFETSIRLGSLRWPVEFWQPLSPLPEVEG